MIQRYFPGVVRTRGSLQLATRAHAAGEVSEFVFEAEGLRIRRPQVPGRDMLTVFRAMPPPVRVESARDLFQQAWPLLDALYDADREHGAVHPGNLLYGAEGLQLVDTGLNRAALFHFGAGPISPSEDQLDYRTWLFALRRPTQIPARTWDLAHLATLCALLERGPAAWQIPWTPARRLEAVERWADTWYDVMPHGSDDEPRLKQAYQQVLVVEGGL